jgi:ATP-binding cassette subfamily B protein
MSETGTKQGRGKKQRLDFNTVLRVLGYILPYWQTKLIFVLIIITTFLEILSPAIIGIIIDMVRDVAVGDPISPGGGMETITYNIINPLAEWVITISTWSPNKLRLAIFSFSLILIAGLTGFMNYIQRYASSYVSQKGAFDVRSDLYNSLLDQSFSFYDQQRTGQLMARATGDIRMLERFYNFGQRMLVSSTLLIILVGYSLISIDLVLTLVSIVTVPFMVYIVRRYAKTVRPMWGEIRQQYGDITSALQENLSGIKVVRGFNRQTFEEEKFSLECKRYLEQNITLAKLRAFFMPLASFTSSLGFVIIIWYGGYQVTAGIISIGSLIAFYFYLARLMGPIRHIGIMTSLVVRTTAAAKRVFEIIDADIVVYDKEDAIDLDNIDGKITFHDVWFSYDDENMVLKDINLEIEPGETVAILGATGSGKSSIINLIPRFYDVTKGRIEIDGMDIRDISIRSLRDQIGIVRQDPFLFSTTIKENISYGAEESRQKEIEVAAKRAKIHKFIESQPKGYDTSVGERGVTLSGGQKQRVAIARALLKNPKILILDDSTSSVDTKTEFEIQQALDELLKNRTTIIITQRLSSIKNADYIIVLDDGEIVEEGNHDKLMEMNGIYRKLYETQISGIGGE